MKKMTHEEIEKLSLFVHEGQVLAAPLINPNSFVGLCFDKETPPLPKIFNLLASSANSYQCMTMIKMVMENALALIESQDDIPSTPVTEALQESCKGVIRMIKISQAWAIEGNEMKQLQEEET